ncbi:expansin family protein, partial [Mycena olivaceomarginata]
AKSKYTQPHSLGDAYTFDPRDGWQTFNASNPHSRRGPTKNDKKKTSSEKPKKGLFDALSQAVSKAYRDLWYARTGYTGHDLLNPSCWAQPQWAPTDDSFICALTLRGWNNKPMCFEFLEVCKTPKTCIFIRVIDTCAGCKADSHHLDLSKGAFKQLGNPDEGVLKVQFRSASKPNDW